jgi:hypothetical protein
MRYGVSHNIQLDNTALLKLGEPNFLREYLYIAGQVVIP